MRARPRQDLDNLVDGLGTFHTHQFLIESAIEIGQPVGIHAHLLQDGGMQVPHVQAIFDRGTSQIVRLANTDSSLDPPTTSTGVTGGVFRIVGDLNGANY